MGEIGEADETEDASRVSRRRALKAGVAAGVGVAVWGGPQIGRIGSIPAYAAHCTPGEFTVSVEISGKVNTNWGGCGDFMEYGKDINHTFTTLPGPPTLNNTLGCSGIPPSDPTAQQTYTVTGVPAGTTCVPVLRVFEQGGAGQSVEVVGNNGFMPVLSNSQFPGGTTGSWFVEAQLKCGPTACFHV